MNWLEIIRLLVLLWPILERIIAAIEGEENKAKATSEAIAAVVQVATAKEVASASVKSDAIVAAVKAVNNVT